MQQGHESLMKARQLKPDWCYLPLFKPFFLKEDIAQFGSLPLQGEDRRWGNFSCKRVP